jgi:hypothetical protein
MYAIEKGIPPPTRGRGWKHQRNKKREKYPWRDMSPGDSFFVPCKEADKMRIMNRLTSAGVRAFGTGKAAVQIFPKGVRAWRLA